MLTLSTKLETGTRTFAIGQYIYVAIGPLHGFFIALDHNLIGSGRECQKLPSLALEHARSGEPNQLTTFWLEGNHLASAVDVVSVIRLEVHILPLGDFFQYLQA